MGKITEGEKYPQNLIDEQYLEQEQNRLKGCRKGFIICIVGSIIVWCVLFELGTYLYHLFF